MKSLLKEASRLQNTQDYQTQEKKDIIEEARIKAVEEIGSDLDSDIQRALMEYKKNNWNASKIDFAYSILSQSQDSLFENAQVEKHLFWLVWAIKPGKNNTWGQVIFGVNNNVVRHEDKFYNQLNGNIRFYAGTNRFKGFIEAQYQNLDSPVRRVETLYSQIGIEIAVYKSIWIHFGTGVLNALDGDTSSYLRSNLNLYFSFPENLKLF